MVTFGVKQSVPTLYTKTHRTQWKHHAIIEDWNLCGSAERAAYTTRLQQNKKNKQTSNENEQQSILFSVVVATKQKKKKTAFFIFFWGGGGLKLIRLVFKKNGYSNQNSDHRIEKP